MTDANWTIQHWNRAAEQIYGWPAADAIGQPISAVIPTIRYIGGDSDGTATQTLLQMGKWQGTFVQRTRTGQELTIEGSTRAILDTHGAINGYIGINRDVSEQKQAEAALRQSDDRFRSVFHASPVPFVVTDALTGRYIEVNDSLLDLMGYTRDELIGQTVLTLNVFIDTQVRTAIRELLAAEGIVRDYATQARTKSGSLLHVLVSVSELITERVACLFIIVIDITSRVQTESALQRAAKRLTVSHAIDRALLALHTPATIAGTALARLRELIPCQYANVSLYAPDGSSATILGAQGDLPGAHPIGIPMPYTTDDDFAAMSRGEPWLSNDLRREPSGNPIVRRLLSLGIHSALRIPLQIQGDLSGVLNLLACSSDAFTSEHVTIAQEIVGMLALALYQEQLIEALQEQLAARTQVEIALTAEHERIVRLKNEFMATMSHELRTPLTAVLGQSELLLEQIHGPLSPRQQTAIQRITDSGQHLLAIINDILDYTLFESGAVALNISPIALSSLCRNSTRMVMQTAQAKQIFIITTLDSAVSTIHADERRLQQVLVNLLANAIKFTPDGGDVGLEVQGDVLQAQVIFTIWDTGIGIAEADLPRLFQPFTQLDGRLSREYEGTGLGLALVLRLVEAHGGNIQVSSTLGQGSRFRVALPWVPDGANRVLLPNT